MISKATELFIESMATEAFSFTSRNSQNIYYENIHAVHSQKREVTFLTPSVNTARKS